jgi:nucleotide-binding universal stress UspA family protein
LRDGPEQAESTGPVDGLQAAVGAELVVQVPTRLDRLRWSPFHTRLVLGLGTAWILDGLEITIASSVSGKLTQAGRVDHRVVADLPGRALVYAAQTTNAQLVVLAARQEIAKILGTVSQYVLRNALCPVLTVSEADIDS